MFGENKNFYPTPKNLIEKMVEKVDWIRVRTILEPSAGKGDIVNWLDDYKENDYHARFKVDCIELDKNLQSVLRGNGKRVIYDDFLKFETPFLYDLIIMNPPYDFGAKHLLKALQLQERNGGAVICLLNAETLKNPCTNERMLLKRKLDEYNAEIEFIKGAFAQAERKTQVEIALIRCCLPKKEKYSFILKNMKKAQDYKMEKENTDYTGQIATNDLIESILLQYNLELEMGIKFLEEYGQIQDKMLCSYERKDGQLKAVGSSIISLDVAGEKFGTSSVNDFVKAVRSKYWRALLSNEKFTGKLTCNLRERYLSQVNDLQNYDFNRFNISEMQIQMTSQMISGVEESIMGLFDELSHKHSWYDETSKNIHYFDGWKTNKAHIINEKVIIPLNGFRHSYYDNTKTPEYGYDVLRKLSDIEKCFNYLDGGITETIDLTNALHRAQANDDTKNIRCKYFSVTFYKKGTCHIKFHNAELLKKFNIFGARGKKWLPPCYGKKKYSELSPEEKTVVDSFDGGEENYSKIISNADYYILEDKNNLLEQSA